MSNFVKYKTYTSANTSNIYIGYESIVNFTPEPKSETPEQWLRRRVEEICKVGETVTNVSR